MKGKDKLIQATSRLLRKYCSASITQMDIAREAGVRQPLIHHYKLKDEIFLEAVKFLHGSDTESYNRVMIRESLCERSRVVKDGMIHQSAGILE